MSWLQANAIPLLNITGLLCDIGGAFLVASEVVRQFRGQKFNQSAGFSFGDFVSNPPPQETDAYKRWDVLKQRSMKWGLGLLVFGFVLQVVANAMQIK